MIARRIPVLAAGTALVFGAGCEPELLDAPAADAGADAGGGDAGAADDASDAAGVDVGRTDTGGDAGTSDTGGAGDTATADTGEAQTLEAAVTRWCEAIRACDGETFDANYGDLDTCVRYGMYAVREFVQPYDDACEDTALAWYDCLLAEGECTSETTYGTTWLDLDPGSACDVEAEAFYALCGAGAFFECDDGSFVPSDEACDGTYDCPDGDDELNCYDLDPFICDDGAVLDWEQVCDEAEDCVGGEDESDLACFGFPIGSWECNDGTPVRHAQMCDGVEDCSVGEDEDPAVCRW